MFTVPVAIDLVEPIIFNVTQLSGEMDNLYRYNVNSTSDLVTYTSDSGELRQALVYWADDRRLHISDRSFPDGQWTFPIDIHNAIGGDQLEYDSHNSTALGFSSDGRFFVTGNHHVDPLNMAVTAKAYDFNSFVNVPRGALNARDTDRVTYPSFTYHTGDMYFSYREQEVGAGMPRFRWLLKRFDAETGKWSTAAQFNSGVRLRLYVSNIATNKESTRMHVAALWRDDEAGGGTQNQHDYFHLYSDDGTTWQQYDIGPVDLPLIWPAGTNTVPSLIWDTPPDPIPNGAGSIAIDSQGYPHMLMKARGGDQFHHYYNGDRWISTELPFNATSSDIYNCAGRIMALTHTSDEISVHSLNPADPSFRDPVLLTKGYVNSNYTLSIDKLAIEHGFVSFMMTENDSHSPNSKIGKFTTDGFVFTGSCADLELSDSPFIK